MFTTAKTRGWGTGSVIGVPDLVAAVARDDDVAIAGADPGVAPGQEVPVAGAADGPREPLREPEPVTLGDASGQADVLPRPIVLARPGRLTGEGGEPVDSFLGDGR